MAMTAPRAVTTRSRPVGPARPRDDDARRHRENPPRVDTRDRLARPSARQTNSDNDGDHATTRCSFEALGSSAVDRPEVARAAVQWLALSGFFDPPLRPVVPEPQRYRMPPWFGARRGTLPGVVALERII